MTCDWANHQARQAPPWTDEQWRRANAILGINVTPGVKPQDPPLTFNARFVGMNDEPLTAEQWGALFEDIEARTLYREAVNDEEELALIWTGHAFEENGDHPWGLVVRHRETGRFRREVAQFPNRAAAEEGWRNRQLHYQHVNDVD
jgi:hypothetical protein